MSTPNTVRYLPPVLEFVTEYHDPKPPTGFPPCPTVAHHLRFPVITDVNALPVKPKAPTPDAPFTYPKPILLTGPRNYVQVFRMRHKLVVLDVNLASLYGVTLSDINRAAMRNACCFPRSVCFRLSNDEWHHICKTTNMADVDRGDWLCAPLAFTNDGALAVSNILDTFDATRGSVLVWRAIGNMEKRENQEGASA